MKRVVFSDLSYIFSLSNRREEQISIQSIILAFYETNVWKKKFHNNILLLIKGEYENQNGL